MVLLIEMKFLGGFYYSPVERNGFCHLNYGEEYSFNEKLKKCTDITFNEDMNVVRIEKPYDESTFRNYCSKPKLLSIKFMSECFKNG